MECQMIQFGTRTKYDLFAPAPVLSHMWIVSNPSYIVCQLRMIMFEMFHQHLWNVVTDKMFENYWLTSDSLSSIVKVLWHRMDCFYQGQRGNPHHSPNTLLKCTSSSSFIYVYEIIKAQLAQPVGLCHVCLTLLCAPLILKHRVVGVLLLHQWR